MLKLLTMILLLIFASTGFLAEVKAQAAIGISYHSQFTSTETDFTGYKGSTNRAMESVMQSGRLFKLSSTVAWDLRNAVFASFSYSNLNAKAISSYREYINVGGELYIGEIEFLTEYEIESIAFAAGNKFQAIDNLFFDVGLQLNYALNDKYYQKEYIKYPADRGVFQQTDSRSKNEVSGNLPDLSNAYLSALLGATYKLPLSRDNKLFADISIAYAYQFISLSTTYDIKFHNFDVGIGVSYYFSGSQQKHISNEMNKHSDKPKTRLSISALSKSGLPIEELTVNSKSMISKPDTLKFRTLILTDENIKKWKLVLLIVGEDLKEELKIIESEGYPPAELSLTLNAEELQSIIYTSKLQNPSLEYFIELAGEFSNIWRSEKGRIRLIIE